MIIYTASRREFGHDIETNQIDSKLFDAVKDKLHRKTSEQEIQSWKNSLPYMERALSVAGLHDEVPVAIEYNVPNTGKRIDFLVAGNGPKDESNVVIVELKQWSRVQQTKKDGIVRTALGRSLVDTTHPSYQAWTYARFIEDFNVEVQDQDIHLHPCAYLHNCTDSSVIKSDFYKPYLEIAPTFLRHETQQLGSFLSHLVRSEGDKNIFNRIDESSLRPSKTLVNHLNKLLDGHPEFVMLDSQKIIYEQVKELASHADQKKQVLIVEGGPGTGKSVLAINLLAELTSNRKTTQYVTKNAAPRQVYHAKLSRKSGGNMTQSAIQSLFVGSGSFTNTPSESFDVLLVDEAHRLNEKSGLYHEGINQIQEIINSARCSVFFLDENQQVHWRDIGNRNEIRRIARQSNATISQMKLDSQFRCNGSDGYLAWVDNTLQIENTAVPSLNGIDYDFRVYDDPNELFREIALLNETNNASRLVAGYCWDWKGKKDPMVKDVAIPEHNFEMKWNLDQDGPLWILQPNSINEVGCIHTCQGLELDYVGVIIGKDFVVRDGIVQTDANERAYPRFLYQRIQEGVQIRS